MSETDTISIPAEQEETLCGHHPLPSAHGPALDLGQNQQEPYRAHRWRGEQLVLVVDTEADVRRKAALPGVADCRSMEDFLLEAWWSAGAKTTLARNMAACAVVVVRSKASVPYQPHIGACAASGP